MDDDLTPPSRTPAGDVLTIETCVAIDLVQMTKNFDHCDALCIQSFTVNCTSQSAGAGIRASILNRFNDTTVRTREVPLVLALCDVITLSHTRGRFTQ